MKKIALLVLLAFPFLRASAQTDDSWKLYDDSQLPRIDVTIDPVLLQWIMDHPQSDSEHVATFRFRNSWIDETVDSIGFRLRGNTSRDSRKKSFKVSFNSFIKGRGFHGLDKLNLNGEHNDPSIIRSKLCFDLFRDIAKVASRANHVQLYVNGLYRGLYISVEHVDDEFLKKNFADDTGNLWKCLYPADLTYKGTSPDVYRQLYNSGRPVYELTTNEDKADFTELFHLIAILTFVSDQSLPDSLEKVMDVHEILKYFAFNVLVGSWDDYWSLMNNYYLYHDPSAGRFSLIPYDYDNTFGIDWFGVDWSTAAPYAFPKVASGSRPLAERLLANATYRDLYTHILQFFSTRVFPLSYWESRIDRIRTMITPAAMADSFRTLDYGFDSTAFVNSYSASSYQNKHVKFGLKQFVNLRSASIAGQLSYLGSSPIAYAYGHTLRTPRGSDSLRVSASCYASHGVKEAFLLLRREGYGDTTIVPLFRDPVAGTKKVEEADRWSGIIPPLKPALRGFYRIVVRDSAGGESTYPRIGEVQIVVSNPVNSPLVINEFMADNDNVVQDPAGEYDDWLELYNGGSTAVRLTGMYLTDKPANPVKWRFTQQNLSLDPGAFLVIWCDEQETQAGIHTNFKLSASGEYIALVDTNGTSVIDSISFGAQQKDIAFGRYPDASSSWVSMTPTPGAPNILTGVREPALPHLFSLAAFPNPFNPEVTIRYLLPSAADVELTIHDILGRAVWHHATPHQTAGEHDVRWQGIGMGGEPLSSGLYIVRLHAGSVQLMQKLLLVR
jgi:spore coat protein CotH